MRILGTTERRVVVAILVTAVIPLVLASIFTQKLLERVSATAFQPEFGARLDQAIGVYADLAKALKQAMRAEADTIARSSEIESAATAHDAKAMAAALEREFHAHPSLVRLRVQTCGGETLGERAREAPLDPTRERALNVEKSIGSAPSGESASADEPLECKGDRPISLLATFATERARLDELDGAEAFSRAYHEIERDHRADYLDATYSRIFQTLLVATIGLAVLLGILVARPVTKRIGKLAEAMRPVAAGDLSVRVSLEGHDEIAELGAAFNGMLEELDRSRARVEFLKRMSEFQKIARRLAHEIKNPLTPIQLAVEEAHRRCPSDDPAYKRVVQTMFEVVEEEVRSLRRLVTEFSSFARLPRADLRQDDLAVFLREQEEHLDASRGEGNVDESALLARIKLEFEIQKGPMPAAIDREMLHRVLSNIIRNGAQALRDARPKKASPIGTVRVSSHTEGDAFAIDIDDDGPGIPVEVRDTLFDPYITTKRDGTGLGLSIVKKIVVDHGGTIEAAASPLGGARFSIRIPREGSAAANAAIERSARDEAPPSTPGRVSRA